MNILFYLEPVIFRNDPKFLVPHLEWIRNLIVANCSDTTRYALATSRRLVSLLQEWLPGMNITYFELDSWKILSQCNFEKSTYCKELYRNLASSQSEETQKLKYLINKMTSVRDAFQPDVIISSAQNSVVEYVFSSSLTLFCEIAPFPRLQNNISIFLDPVGHQTNSILANNFDAINSLPFCEDEVEKIISEWKTFTKISGLHKQKLQDVANSIQALRNGRKVALFAMQPQDWLSYEGAFNALDPGAVIAMWAQELPPGWVGVPIYHPSARLSFEIESTLAAEYDNIAFLPESLSQNVAELAILAADALITISSTAALTTGLHGLPVVVVGKSAFSRIFPASIAHLHETFPLERHTRAALIAFITHRYCHPMQRYFHEKGYFENLIRWWLEQDSDMAPLLDLSTWSVASIEAYR